MENDNEINKRDFVCEIKCLKYYEMIYIDDLTKHCRLIVIYSTRATS